MKIIGITGQTGAGKSAVCKLLSETCGYFHIDADAVAKEVINNNKEVLSELKKAFGEDVVFNDGRLNRKRLAEKAFKDKKSIELLNSITHPKITEEIKKIIKNQDELGAKAVMIDAIALFESGENKLCDFTAAVIAPLSVRLERILERDELTENQALLRINAQQAEEYYKEKADIIINNYPPIKLIDEVSKIICYE